MSEAELYRFFVANCKITFADIVDSCSNAELSLAELLALYTKAVHKHATQMMELAK
jgi:hypothetical protein